MSSEPDTDAPLEEASEGNLPESSGDLGPDEEEVIEKIQTEDESPESTEEESTEEEVADVPKAEVPAPAPAPWDDGDPEEMRKHELAKGGWVAFAPQDVICAQRVGKDTLVELQDGRKYRLPGHQYGVVVN